MQIVRYRSLHDQLGLVPVVKVKISLAILSRVYLRETADRLSRNA